MRTKIFYGTQVLLVGVVIGILVDRSISTETHLGNGECSTDFAYINPQLDCELFEKKATGIAELQQRLESDVDARLKNGDVTRMGVFTRDLKTHRFAGVNENEQFYMASLLKLPLLIGGFKLAEVEPLNLVQEIEYTGNGELYEMQIIKPEQRLQKGESYSIHELMERTIIYSDNEAARMLDEYYPVEFLDRIMQALGLEFRKPSGSMENPVTPRVYANVFRSLYNSSYLTREYANEALTILTKTRFKSGALKLLPENVVVAHKFGERTVVDEVSGRTLRQLHECGIVYADDGKEPYSFCIMTEGMNYETLEKVMQQTSLTIYTFMTREE